MSALFTALAEGETKESLASMVCDLRAINAALLAELKHADRWLSGMHSDADGDDITELREVHGAAWEAIDKMRAAIAKAKP